MFGQCDICKTKKITPCTTQDLDEDIAYSQWEKVKKEVNKLNKSYFVAVTSKEEQNPTLGRLIDAVNAKLKRLAKHVFTLKNQYND